ncbi:Cellobiose phospho transferase system YdjC-like protein [Salmonella enterica subsp. enterica]|nr:Cellobiose phospho transferase system YdjC-like protein [Salmonella enterica subsp. enterica]
MERVLIVNADDFGLSKGQNYGIVEAYRNGVVTSTTALVNGEAIDHAAQLSRELPALGVGMPFCFDVRQTGVRDAGPDARRPVGEMDLANGGGGYASAG